MLSNDPCVTLLSNPVVTLWAFVQYEVRCRGLSLSGQQVAAGHNIDKLAGCGSPVSCLEERGSSVSAFFACYLNEGDDKRKHPHRQTRYVGSVGSLQF